MYILNYTGLPYEILFKVFDYATHSSGNLSLLNKFCLICRYWRKVGNDARLWHHVNLSTISPSKFILSTKTLTSVSSRGKEIKLVDDLYQQFILRLVKNATISKQALGLQNKFQYIHTLDLSFLCFLTCDSLKLVLSNCNPNILTSLNLTYCKRIHKSDNNLLLGDVIAEHSPNLKVLNLTGHEMSLVKNIH